METVLRWDHVGLICAAEAVFCFPFALRLRLGVHLLVWFGDTRWYGIDGVDN